MSQLDPPVSPPDAIADEIAALPRPVLLALDCDGVLAPIVEHADEARLLDGTDRALERLTDQPEIDVAVVSGRSLDGLAQFGFPDDVVLVGSHGAERRGVPMPPLDADEAALLARVDELVERARSEAGAGAWVERKPASRALHVREADAAAGARALSVLADEAGRLDDVVAKPGSMVLELVVRSVDKGTALCELRDELSPGAIVFIGDDHTDEDGFATLGTGDLAVKVGDDPTCAGRRLADPEAVRTLLERLADGFDG